MDRDFCGLMYLYSCSVLGLEPENRGYNLKNVFKTAHEQGVFDAVFLSVKKLFDRGELDVPKDEFNKLSAKFLSCCVLSIKKQDAINSLLLSMKNNGFECVLLKGYTLSRFYKYPEVRQAGDTDILIDESREKDALKFLSDRGFTVSVRSKNGNHSECYSKKYGLVELHTKLYYNLMSDIWFDNEEMIKEPYIDVGNYKTLGITDGFLYVYLHAVKHFLSAGLSIRQVMDVLLYIREYKSKIDWQRVLGILEKLKYKDFLFILTKIGTEYMNFSYDETVTAEVDEGLVQAVLEDIKNSGLFGRKNNFGNDMYYAYSKKRYEKKKRGDFNKYVTQKMRGNTRAVLSFGFDNLSQRYPYLNKSKLLYPSAVFNHIYFILKTAIKKPRLVKNTVGFQQQNSEKIETRLKELEKLKMI